MVGILRTVAEYISVSGAFLATRDIFDGGFCLGLIKVRERSKVEVVAWSETTGFVRTENLMLVTFMYFSAPVEAWAGRMMAYNSATLWVSQL